MHSDFCRDGQARKRHLAGAAPRSDPGRRISPQRLLERTLEDREGAAVEFGSGRVLSSQDPV